MSLHPDYPIGGCDVSYWQSSIDFDKLLDKDVWFLIARASVGTQADTKYPAHKSGAIAAGLPVGAYHYWMPSYMVSANCDALTTAQPTRPPMGIWLDLEGKGFTLTKMQLSEHIYQCLQVLDAHYGTPIGLYTRASWWNYWIDDSYYDLYRLDKRPLWVAQYFYEFQPAPTAVPNGWGSPILWQYSAEQGPYAGQASEFGVTGSQSLDIDAWMGTEAQFRQFTSTIQPPIEIPKYVTVKASGTNIRNAPILAALSDVGDLTKGATLEVLAQSGDFYQVKTYVHKSVVTDVVIPPPPTVTEYRVLHDWETNQPAWRDGVPEVFWLEPNTLTTPIPKDWQWFNYALNRPGITPEQNRKLFDWQRAFTNGPAGYDNPGGKLHCDYINKRDLISPPPLFDKPRVCGGAILRGKLDGNILHIETLDGNQAPPIVWSGILADWDGYVKAVADWAKAHYWLCFRAVTISNGKNYNFPQGNGQPVLIPLVTSAPVTVQIETLKIGKPYPYVVKA